MPLRCSERRRATSPTGIPGIATAMSFAISRRVNSMRATSDPGRLELGRKEVDDAERHEVRDAGDDEHGEVASGRLQEVTGHLRDEHAADGSSHSRETDHR